MNYSDLAGYKVVCDASASPYLLGAAKWLSKKLGCAEDADKLIVVFVNKCVIGWTVSISDCHITICGESEPMTVNGVYELCSSLAPSQNDGAQYRKNGWQIAAPAYEGGRLCEVVYNDGSGISSDDDNVTSNQCYMQGISDTSADEFSAYLEKLEKCGYKRVFYNTMKSREEQDNLFAQYQKGEATVYTYYVPAFRTTRVVEDRASVAIDKFEYKCDFDTHSETDIILYGIKLHPRGICCGEKNSDPTYLNCGALLMMKLADNSLFVIDGGHDLQATPAAQAELWRYMHEITGTPDGETVRISCWFITHSDSDHFVMIMKLLEDFTSELKIERMLFNYQKTNMRFDNRARMAVERLSPDTKVLKCRAGMSFTVASVRVDVMTAHEDTFDPENGKRTWYHNNNDNSNILRITTPDNRRYMILGDYTTLRMPNLLATYAEEEFRCDIVQIAHHSWNDLGDLYMAIGAEYALWPQYPYTNFYNPHQFRNATRCAKHLEAAGAKYHYYSGINTANLVCKDGNIEVILTDTIY